MAEGENKLNTKIPTEVNPQKPLPSFEKDSMVAAARELGGVITEIAETKKKEKEPEIPPEELEALTENAEYTDHLKTVEKPITEKDSEKD
ncbi:TPA: hypothetical protein DEP90_02290 [Patescibacteria group bacterium]|nr:hypothetical protein [Patescibacteria group bacterium]